MAFALARYGATLVIVSHEIGFAREVADRVVFLDGGRILEQGTAAEMLDHPRHPRTREFLSKIPWASRSLGHDLHQFAKKENTCQPWVMLRVQEVMESGSGGVALALGLTSCASSTSAVVTTNNSGTTVVDVGAHSNGAATETKISVPEVASIRAQLSKSILASGKLVIGEGDLPAGTPPLGFLGDGQKTQTGSEPDIGRLIAAVFGLTPVIDNATWDNVFVGIDSGRTDVGFSNITDTEQRQETYDFASCRQDNLAFEVLKSSTWNFGGDYENLARQTVAVGSGTNQEKNLLQWQSQLKAQGKTLTIKYYPDDNATDGLAKPLADAINYLIAHGQYAQWLAAYNLSNEAVPTSLVNPPGSPLTNS